MRVHPTIVLPKRVTRQPETFLVPGGDCGACVLSGVLDLPIPEVYIKVGRYRTPPTTEPKSIGYYEMKSFLQQEEGDLFEEAIVQHPLWMPHSGWDLTFGNPGHMQTQGWIPYIRMAFTAGFYGLCLVDMKKAGATGFGPDHWVLICGFRERTETTNHPEWGESTHYYSELLVSNSARSQPAEEWVSPNTFLRLWGGFNALLVKPFSKP